MSKTHKMKSVYTHGSTVLDAVVREVTGGNEVSFDLVVAAGGINVKSTLGTALTLANLMSLYWVADQALVVKAGGANEVQRLSMSGSPTGTFTLTYSGQTTGAIAATATAAVVQAALWALSNIADGDVTCTGGPLPATPIDVEFTQNLALTNVVAMTSTDTLSGGSTSLSTTTAGAAATTTLSIAANLPLWWDSAGIYSFPIAGTTLSALWLSNASGSQASLKAVHLLSS